MAWFPQGRSPGVARPVPRCGCSGDGGGGQGLDRARPGRGRSGPPRGRAPSHRSAGRAPHRARHPRRDPSCRLPRGRRASCAGARTALRRAPVEGPATARTDKRGDRHEEARRGRSERFAGKPRRGRLGGQGSSAPRTPAPPGARLGGAARGPGTAVPRARCCAVLSSCFGTHGCTSPPSGCPNSPVPRSSPRRRPRSCWSSAAKGWVASADSCRGRWPWPPRPRRPAGRPRPGRRDGGGRTPPRRLRNGVDPHPLPRRGGRHRQRRTLRRRPGLHASRCRTPAGATARRARPARAAHHGRPRRRAHADQGGGRARTHGSARTMAREVTPAWSSARTSTRGVRPTSSHVPRAEQACWWWAAGGDVPRSARTPARWPTRSSTT